jgi:N-acylneuraminate cytidylyltransferase
MMAKNMTTQKVAAIIPIKDHSERVPEKNFRLLGGVPLYQIIIRTLLHSTLVEHVYIDTDSKRIKESSVFHGERVTILERSEELIGDMVSVNKIIADDINRIPGEFFLQTHCTNPFINTSTIDAAIQIFFGNAFEYDSLFSVTALRSRFYNSNFSPINHDPNELLRTQDLLPIYEENSNMYIFSREGFLKNNEKRIGRKPYLFEMNKIEALDIDNEDDFKLAEALCASVIGKRV